LLTIRGENAEQKKGAHHDLIHVANHIVMSAIAQRIPPLIAATIGGITDLSLLLQFLCQRNFLESRQRFKQKPRTFQAFLQARARPTTVQDDARGAVMSRCRDAVLE
jgi:hypothetical protein